MRNATIQGDDWHDYIFFIDFLVESECTCIIQHNWYQWQQLKPWAVCKDTLIVNGTNAESDFVITYFS